MRHGDPLQWDMNSGEWNPHAKLSHEDVKLIRELLAERDRIRREAKARLLDAAAAAAEAGTLVAEARAMQASAKVMRVQAERIKARAQLLKLESARLRATAGHLSVESIAEKWDVSKRTIDEIRARKRYKHV